MNHTNSTNITMAIRSPSVVFLVGFGIDTPISGTACRARSSVVATHISHIDFGHASSHSFFVLFFNYVVLFVVSLFVSTFRNTANRTDVLSRQVLVTVARQ